MRKKRRNKIVGAAIRLIVLAFIANSIVSAQTPTPEQNTDQIKKIKADAMFNEANNLFNQGTLESYLSALEKFQQTGKIYEEIGDKSLNAGFSWLGSGLVSDNLGRKQDALTFYDKGLKFFQEIKNKELETTILNNIGLVYDSLGEKQKALKYYDQALLIKRQIGDKPGEATTLNNIGSAYSSLGEKYKALEYFNQSLLLKKQLGDKSSEAVTLNNIGRAYDSLGEKQKALDYFNQSLSLRRQIVNKAGEATTLNNIGLVYDSLGEKQKALDHFNQSLLIIKQVGDKSGEGAMLNNIGSVYDDLGEKQKALDYYNQALSLRKQVSDKSGEADTLNNIGFLYNSLDKKQKALDYFNQALPLRREVGDKSGEAITLNNIGSIYDNLGESQKALDYYNRALSLIRIVGNKTSEATTLYNLMFYWNKYGTSRLAVFYGKQAIDIFQELRSNIQGLDNENQKTYLKKIEGAYRKLADILIADDRLSEAQQVLDLFKDQQFYDFNRDPNESIKKLVKTSRESEYAVNYRQAGEKISRVDSKIGELKRKTETDQAGASETSEIRKLESDLKIETESFLAIFKRAETDFSKPADEKDKVGAAANTTETQAVLRNLNRQTKQKTAAIYTLVGENNFRALIVSSDNIKSVSSPIKKTELDAKALKLWGLLQSDKYDTTVLSKQIYDVVFAPIEKEMPKDTTTIMWSLDGNLRYLPMAALFDGKRFLAERFNHVNFTRADGERITRAANQKWSGTGFGSSNAQTVELLGDKISFSALPGVTEELREIFKQNDSKKGILTGEVLPDKQFTKTSFFDALKAKRPVVHIASHFSFRPGDEARSFLLLGNGTALTLSEIKAETNLFQGVDLLTLSACNTAAAQADANGREIDGFAELAQRLGAGAVMATLWSVSDASTPWLMRDFYATKQSKAEMTKAEALRQAQLRLLNGTATITKSLPVVEKGSMSDKLQVVVVSNGEKSGQDKRGVEIVIAERDAPLFKKNDKKPFAHPYYWSPFILFGNWR